jgi:hypothetical protein
MPRLWPELSEYNSETLPLDLAISVLIDLRETVVNRLVCIVHIQDVLKGTLQSAIQAQRVCRGKVILICNFCAKWGGLSKRGSGRFTPENVKWYLPYRRLGGPQLRSGRVCRRENFLFLPRFEPRTVQPVANRYPGFRRLKVMSNYEKWMCIQHTKTAPVQSSDLFTLASYIDLFQLQGFYKYECVERSLFDFVSF